MGSIYFFKGGNLYVRKLYLKRYFNIESSIIESYQTRVYKYNRMHLILFSDLEYRLKDLIIHSFGNYENQYKKPLPICPVILSKLYNSHFKKSELIIRQLESENKQIKGTKQVYKGLNIQNFKKFIKKQQDIINVYEDTLFTWNVLIKELLSEKNELKKQLNEKNL